MNVVYIHNGILAIKKNEIMPFAATWMDLEIIILSEVSQTEKDKYHLYVESKKMIQMNLFTKQKWLTDIENTLMVTKGERVGRKDKLGVWD